MRSFFQKDQDLPIFIRVIDLVSLPTKSATETANYAANFESSVNLSGLICMPSMQILLVGTWTKEHPDAVYVGVRRTKWGKRKEEKKVSEHELQLGSHSNDL